MNGDVIVTALEELEALQQKWLTVKEALDEYVAREIVFTGPVVPGQKSTFPSALTAVSSEKWGRLIAAARAAEDNYLVARYSYQP